MKKALLFAAAAVGYLMWDNGVFSGMVEQLRNQWELEQRTRKMPERRAERQRRRRMMHRDADGLLDLNRATRKELQDLGFDHESAERILENRPFLTKMDLIGRRVVPDALYETLKDKICVHHQLAA